MIKNPRNSVSWNGIREMTDAERQVVERIVDLYTPEAEPAEGAVIEGAIVIDYETAEVAARALQAFQLRGFKQATAYTNKPAIRIPFTKTYSDEEVDEVREIYGEEEVLNTLKTDSMNAMLTEVDAIASFIEENEVKTTGYINKAEFVEVEGEDSKFVKNSYIFAFNLGRVNVSASIDDLVDYFTRAVNEEFENVDKVIKLGQLVTRTQAFETTELGKMIEGALPALLQIGQSFLSILA